MAGIVQSVAQNDNSYQQNLLQQNHSPYQAPYNQYQQNPYVYQQHTNQNPYQHNPSNYQIPNQNHRQNLFYNPAKFIGDMMAQMVKNFQPNKQEPKDDQNAFINSGQQNINPSSNLMQNNPPSFHSMPYNPPHQQPYQTSSYPNQYNDFQQNDNSFQSSLQNSFTNPLQNTYNQQSFGQVAYQQQYPLQNTYNQQNFGQVAYQQQYPLQNSFPNSLQNTYNQQSFGQVANHQHYPTQSLNPQPYNQLQQNILNPSFNPTPYDPYNQQNFGQAAYPQISTTEVSTTTEDFTDFDYEGLGKYGFYIKKLFSQYQLQLLLNSCKSSMISVIQQEQNEFIL
jgi:hypothetical protein